MDSVITIDTWICENITFLYHTTSLLPIIYHQFLPPPRHTLMMQLMGFLYWKLWLSKCITWLSFSKSMTLHMKSLNCSKIFYTKIAFVKNKANYAKYQSIPIYCLQIVCIFPGEMMVINGIWLRVRNCTVFAMLWDESLTRVNLKIVHNKCPL